MILKPEEQRQATVLYEPQQQRPKPKLQAPPLPERAAEPNLKAQLAPEQQPVPTPPRAIQPPTPPKPAQPSEPAGGQGKDLVARSMEPIGIPDFPKEAPEPPKQRPAFEPIPKEKDNPEARLQVPELAAPSRGTDDILRDIAKQHAEGRGLGTGGGQMEVDPNNPDFNLPGPQILSDTMGVDFDPYLLRVYLSVRRNWYAVIPEIARMGRKGRVVLTFSIMRNGSVPDLALTLGSGTSSMDSAALSSIRLSNPFPPLPAEFPGSNIQLRFVYFYNMRPE